jgi:hypothetical protein
MKLSSPSGQSGDDSSDLNELDHASCFRSATFWELEPLSLYCELDGNINRLLQNVPMPGERHTGSGKDIKF